MPADWIDIPDWLAGALDAVMADIHGADPIPGLTLRAHEFDPGLWLVGVFEPDGTGGGGGAAVGPATPFEELLVAVAELVQGKCLEATANRGQARPACPGHPHPAEPDLLDGQAWWVCPARGTRLSRIGGR